MTQSSLDKRLGALPDFIWIALGCLIAPMIAIALDVMGLIDLEGWMVLATAALSAASGGVIRGHREQVRERRTSNGRR